MSDTSLVHDPSTNEPPAPAAPQSPAEIAAYLDFACAQLKVRRGDLVTALENNFAKHPTISNDDTLGVVAENVRMANTLLNKTAKERHKQHKEPHLTAGRAVDTWFRTWAVPLENALEPVQKAMNAYGERKLEAERIAAEEAQERAAKEAARLAEIAASAMERRKPTADDALQDAVQAAEAAIEADTRANSRPADVTRSYSSYGAVASVRQKWKWEIENIDLVPRQFLMINEDAIKAAGKQRDARGKPIAVIAGVRWVPETKMGVR